MSRRRRKGQAASHVEWLNLVDVSGPFLSLSVLSEAFPQGLNADEPPIAALVRGGYESWDHNRQLRRPDPAIHRAWIELVLGDVLGYDHRVLREGQALPETLKATLPEHHVTLRPDFAVARDGDLPTLLVSTFSETTGLERARDEGGLHASPVERMRLILRATGVRSGLVTNGEQWILVHQPPERTATFVAWESELLAEERDARRAFRSLLGIRRLLGVADPDTLDSLFERSRDDEREVTDQLGAQTRRAVELVVSAMDRADRAAGGTLMREEPLDRVYEAAVVVAMRIIFLLAAEARGLMPDDGPWVEGYAMTPLREQLRASAEREGEEVLDRRFDAWPRMLATFRAVHGGVEHDRVRLPGYGGGLFDPARYPFLEAVRGRPLRISNRVVLHVLDSLQMLEVEVPGGRERRPLSFRALGVEQIGHVYEGLLDHEAVRVHEPWIGLTGTSKKEPELSLPELERELADGEEALLKTLKAETGRGVPALRRALDSDADAERGARLRAACDNDDALVERVLPFIGLVRDDAFRMPAVFPPDAVFVTASSRRRATGTHYTPPSLTEPIVRHALEPIVYRGPAEGRPPQEWELKRPAELLELKVCDIAVGSAAFLVAACRYLAARLVESWDEHPKERPGAAGADPEERDLTARRLVAERCLYGVDKNPLAVEIAKVALWLVTLRKDRPFTFVDHALRSGDSLLGVSAERQFLDLALRSESRADPVVLDAPRQIVHQVLERAGELREQIETTDAIDLHDVEQQHLWLKEAEEASATLRTVGDLIVGAALAGAASRDPDAPRDLLAAHAPDLIDALGREDVDAVRAVRRAASDLLESGRRALAEEPPRPFHWPLEFPEIFTAGREGFDAIIGNPPFVGGVDLAAVFGVPYERLMKTLVPESKGFVDLVAYFHRRAHELGSSGGVVCLLGPQTLTVTANRRASVEAILALGRQIGWARKRLKWPGTASVEVSTVLYVPEEWSITPILGNEAVDNITASLASGVDVADARRLRPWLRYSQGTDLYGGAFIRPEDEWRDFVSREPDLEYFLRPYVNAQSLCESPTFRTAAVVPDFGESDKDQLTRVSATVRELEVAVGNERKAQTRQVHEHRPWLFWDKRTATYREARKLGRVLVCPNLSKFLPISFVTPHYLFSKGVKVIVTDDGGVFGLLQSTVFLSWVMATSALRGSGIAFSTANSLDSFVPPTKGTDVLRFTGEKLWGARIDVMTRRDCGITTVLNDLHDRDENASDVRALRELQTALDRAVADAYGWTDLELVYDFRETPVGLRYTIDEPTRVEALDRLLELNHARHADEVARGLHDKKAKRPKSHRAPTDPGAEQGVLADA